MRSVPPENPLSHLHEIDQERLNQIVDFFLFVRADFWPDGHVFRPLIILNACGIRTNYSCEGANKAHRRPLHYICLPGISLTTEEDPFLGKGCANPSELLNSLLDDFYSENTPSLFKLVMQKEIFTCVPSHERDLSQFPLTQEDHDISVQELLKFTLWLEEKLLKPGISFDAAWEASFPGIEDSTNSDISSLPLGVKREHLPIVAAEYTEKGLPIEIARLIERTQRKLFALKVLLTH